MRWLFLLLITLNVFYYVWHQQEAPLRVKEVTPLALYRGGQQNIQLLSELSSGRTDSLGIHNRVVGDGGECLYLGGVEGEDANRALRQRLDALGVDVAILRVRDAEWEGDWLRVSPTSRSLLGNSVLQSLSREFNELKHKIMPCEGIATLE